MADLMIGNKEEVAAASLSSHLLATVTADGVNTVDVDTVAEISVGAVIDIAHKTTGAVLASARVVNVLDIVNNRITYSGADVTATTSHGIYLSGRDPLTNYLTNINGGHASAAGFSSRNLRDIDAMRARLAAINGTYYTAAVLNMMTYNDMVYAIRLNDFPATIKQ